MKCKRYLYANMELTDNDFLMELPVGMFLLVVFFCFFLFRNLNDSVSRYAACGCVLTLLLLVLLIFMAAKGLVIRP